jgi:hypothetical protein
MRMGNKVVFGIYKNRTAVEDALAKFRDEGFRMSDLSVLLPEGSLTDDFAHVKQTKAPEGATTGAASGIVLGGALGWLVGVGAIALTGVAPLIAAGPIIAALAGAGVGGAVGTLTGALLGMGIPEYEAKRFENQVSRGGILFSVHADDSNWVTKAEELMKQTGAEDIASATEAASDLHNPKKSTSRNIDSTVFRT